MNKLKDIEQRLELAIVTISSVATSATEKKNQVRMIKEMLND